MYIALRKNGPDWWVLIPVASTFMLSGGSNCRGNKREPIVAENEVRLIKKYPNRRLYDTEESKYIKLTQVRDLIMQDIPFKVVDSQSNEDITRNILLQIILEQESESNPLFSNENLQHFIQYYSDNTRQGFSGFMEQSLNFFHEQQEMMQSQMKDMMGMNPMKYWSDMGEKNMEMWKDMQKEFLNMAGLGNKDKD